MAQVNAFRVLVMPANPQPNSLYFLKNGNKAEAYITNAQGQLFPIINVASVNEAVAQQIGLSIAPTKFPMNTPAATWTITHSLGHIPIAEVFDATGNKILVDVFVDMTYIVVTFPFPSVGFVLAF